MSYGSPTSDEANNSNYYVQFQYQSYETTTLALEGPTSRDDTNDAQRDAAFQAFVDLIDSSADFTLIAAVKTYAMREAISPTP